MINIPGFFHPTTLIFVDDDPRFINSICFELPEDVTYLKFSSPIEALEYLKLHPTDNEATQYLIANTDSQSYGVDQTEHETKLRLKSLFSKIYDVHRFQENIIVIMDYSMHEMNGLEFCKNIADRRLRKIMLTGVAEDSIGIKALNTNLINGFIRKQASNFVEELIATIKDLEIDYFKTVSQTLLENLQTESFFCLADPILVEKVMQIFSENHAVEYYLIDSNGGYLFLNKDGNVFRLVLMNESNLDEYILVAEDHRASENTLRWLKERKKIPFFQDINEYMDAEGKSWENYLYPSERLQGVKDIFYYSLLKDTSLVDLKRDRIVSYNQYLHDFSPEKLK